MIKRLTQWNPRKELSREDAVQRWTGEHAELVRRVPGLNGYVQNVCTVGPDGREPPFAGLGEVWFDSFEAAQAASATREWNAVIEDAKTFMDLEVAIVAWAEENVVAAPAHT